MSSLSITLSTQDAIVYGITCAHGAKSSQAYLESSLP